MTAATVQPTDPQPIDFSRCSDRLNRYLAVLLGIATEAEIDEQAAQKAALQQASDDDDDDAAPRDR